MAYSGPRCRDISVDASEQSIAWFGPFTTPDVIDGLLISLHDRVNSAAGDVRLSVAVIEATVEPALTVAAYLTARSLTRGPVSNGIETCSFLVSLGAHSFDRFPICERLMGTATKFVGVFIDNTTTFDINGSVRLECS